MCMLSHSVMSNSLRPHGLKPARLFCPWDFSGKITGGVAISSSRGTSQPRDQAHISVLAGRLFFTIRANKEA